MVRSKPLRGGRPQAPSAPTRRQLQQLATTSDSVQTSSDVESSTRKAALDRRRALTTAGKAAQLGGAPVVVVGFAPARTFNVVPLLSQAGSAVRRQPPGRFLSI